MSKTTLKIDSSLLVSVENEQVFTTSIQISEAFEKRHDNIVRAIESLECSEEFRILNFEETPYTNPQNKQTYKAYKITRDGFTILAMGFTGKKAMAFKEAYIRAFNQMEQELLAIRQERLAELESKVQSLESRYLTTQQARHIQEVVSDIFHHQGIHYSTTYHNLKTVFKVRSYKEIERERYEEVCAYLGVEPKFSTKIAENGQNSTRNEVKTPKNRDALSFTERDTLGRLRNFVSPQSTGDWHDDFRAGQTAANELKAMVSSAKAKTVEDGEDATRFALQDIFVGNFEGHGHLCGFLAMIAQYAVLGMRSNPALPVRGI